jgi:hypothetical protein
MAVRHPRVARAWVVGFARAIREIPEIWRLRRAIRRAQVVSTRTLRRRFLAEGRAAETR